MNLNQITVPSTHVDRAVAFYQKLGLELIVKSSSYNARFQCPNGDSTFSIHQVEQVPKGGGIYVYFECEDLDVRVEKLRKLGFEFDLLPTDQPWLWREARLRDPDGNQLILYWAGVNRKDPPWKLKGEKK